MDPDVLQALLDALLPENKKPAERERAFKALLALAERRPDLRLPRWDEPTRMLRRGGAFTKYPALYLIAALLPADRQRRFDRSFAAYFDLLDDKAVSVAARTARLAARVVAARPDLEPRVTRRLLALDRTLFETRPARPGEELRAGSDGDLPRVGAVRARHPTFR